MSAVVITRAVPFNNPTTGTAYDAFILRGFRGVSSTVTITAS